ncbi:uncharacterized protein LOC34617274 [Cyclospora cayetanensis]|uniref:Uncharacterized protein n=2 Tax=Cyclospora cayetanensis TaxID=88456 RepID=A0A1D3CSI5_9EIME|nr:uncharacterized protein LOC34617274 [Cyclospora cayetanensis]OEH74157.1 hypothetical protein cyc_00038 [Cyclospora cayetanensis]
MALRCLTALPVGGLGALSSAPPQYLGGRILPSYAAASEPLGPLTSVPVSFGVGEVPKGLIKGFWDSQRPSRCLRDSWICGARAFSTRRKTVKAIGAWHLQQEARRRARRLEELTHGGLLPSTNATLEAATAPVSFQPKYSPSPLFLSPPPSPPALFTQVSVAPAPFTRKNPPPELQHLPPRRPMGRVSALKSTELAVAVVEAARSHRGNATLWQELHAACLRRGPHFSATEAALVLHGYALAGLNVLPVLCACSHTLLTKWGDVRLVDAARALHALLKVFKLQDTRMTLKFIDSFGPVLRHRSSRSRTKDLEALPREEALQHLHTLALLLKAFAAVQLPYPPLLLTAATVLRAELLLVAVPCASRAKYSSSSKSSREKDSRRIFELPPIADPKSLGGPLLPPPAVVVSILEGLTALGFRSEPLFGAFGAFLAATLPGAVDVSAPGGSPPQLVIPRGPQRTPAAGYWGSPPYPYALHAAMATATACSSLKTTRESGWTPQRAANCGGPRREKVTGNSAPNLPTWRHPQAATDQVAATAASSDWSFRLLSRAMKALGSVGSSCAPLIGGWVGAVRHRTHRSSPEDLVLALEASRSSSFFCRPLLLLLLGALAHRAADRSLPVELHTLFSAAISAAQLPVSLPAFWEALNASLSHLQREHRPRSGPPLPEGCSGEPQRMRTGASQTMSLPGRPHLTASSLRSFSLPRHEERGCGSTETAKETTPGSWGPQEEAHNTLTEDSSGASLGQTERAHQCGKGEPLLKTGGTKTGAAEETEKSLSVRDSVSLLEAVALAFPALPLSLLVIALPGLRRLGQEGLPLSFCLRALGMLELVKLKASAGAWGASLSGSATVTLRRSSVENSSSSNNSALVEAIAEVQGVLLRDARHRVRVRLQHQLAGGALKSGGVTEEGGPSSEDSWLCMVRDSPAMDLHLRELCLYGVLSPFVSHVASNTAGWRVPQEDSLAHNGGERRAGSLAGDLGPLQILRQVRGLVLERSCRWPLVFVSVEDAVSLLHLELLPYCQDVGQAIAATRLLHVKRGAAFQPQKESRGHLHTPPPKNRGMPCQRGYQATVELDSLRTSLSGPKGGDYPRADLQKPCGTPLEPWGVDKSSMEAILNCFSSRLVTSATPTLLHAATLTFKALAHPRLQGLLRQSRTGARDRDDAARTEAESKNLPPQDTTRHFGGTSLEESQRRGGPPCEAVKGEGAEGMIVSEEKEKVAMQLLCEVCQLSVEALQQRLQLLQANELSLVAADAQALLCALRAPHTGSVKSRPQGSPSRMPTLMPARDQHGVAARLYECVDECLESTTGRTDEKADHSDNYHLGTASPISKEATSGISQLEESLERLLEALAARWRAVPVTVSSAGPASSLNVCLQLGLGGAYVSAATKAPQGDNSSIFLRPSAADGPGHKDRLSEEFEQRVRNSALLETLCPGISTPEALRWLNRKQANCTQGAELISSSIYQETTALMDAKVSPQQWGNQALCSMRGGYGDSLPRGQKGDSLDAHAQGGSQAGALDIDNCLKVLAALKLRYTPTEWSKGCPRHRTACLLTSKTHYNLALSWLSQILRYRVAG